MARSGTVAVLVMGGVVAVACARREPAPPVPVVANVPPPVAERFVDRAPASTRVLVRIGREGLASYRSSIEALIAAAGRADDCGDPWSKIDEVRGALGPDALLVEVDGAITIADVACLGGGEPRLDGTIVLAGTYTVAARAGGLRVVERPQFPTGAPAALGARFDAGGAAAAGVFAVADLGSADRPVHVDLAMAAGHTRATVDVADASVAERLHAIVEKLAAVASAGGTAALVTRTGTAVTLEADELGVAGALALRMQALEAFKIPSSGMWPSLELGDFVFVLKGDLLGPVQRGDLVVFRDGERMFIERVAAIGGQRIHIDGGRVTVDGVAVPQTAAGTRGWDDQDEATGEWVHLDVDVATETLGSRSYAVGVDHSGRPAVDVVVPAGHFFALGDNRGNSNDSRARGTFPISDVVGRLALVWLSRGPSGVRWDRLLTPVD